MVPISFENINRSAGVDTLQVYPVSDAARATHESFESHLQQATDPTISTPPREPPSEDNSHHSDETPTSEAPRHEPIRQDADEARQDSVQRDDSDELVAADEVPGEDHGEDLEQQPAAEEEGSVTPTEEQQAAIQELKVEIIDESTDVDDAANAKNVSDGSLLDEHTKTDAVPKTVDELAVELNAEDSVEGVATREPGSSTARESVDETHQTPGTDEASQRLVEGESREQSQQPTVGVAEESPKTESAKRKRGTPNDASANVSTKEVQAAVAKRSDEAAIDVATENQSQERRHSKDGEPTPSTANTPTGDATTNAASAPSRFAQHLLARSGDSNIRGQSITDADQARFVDRVARALQATGDRGGTLRIRLSPPELGSLTLEVKVQGGAVSARVEADTPAARSLLLENLPVLRERLAEQGLRVDQFDVDLTDRHPDQTPDGLRHQDRQQEDRAGAETPPHETDDTPEAESGDLQSHNGNEQLNIIV